MFESEKTILLAFGTRPELIKLAPVAGELRRRKIPFSLVNSGQHSDLIATTLQDLDIEITHDLSIMTDGQTPNHVAAKAIVGIDELLHTLKPAAVLAQGDTTTAFAAAFAAFNRQIVVGHVEAGLRSGNKNSPFPEEINRRLITKLADLHFAATENNRLTLINEGIADADIFVTGNTVVDALLRIKGLGKVTDRTAQLLDHLKGKKFVLMTMHRRESFGSVMIDYLQQIARSARENDEVSFVFPVHPNPNVKITVTKILGGLENVHLIDPVCHSDFIALMAASWLLVSDSGGVQEEAASLGKALYILRQNTERQEAIDAGFARLVGDQNIYELLSNCIADQSFIDLAKTATNPFGDGRAAEKIVDALCKRLNIELYQERYAG